MKQKERGKPIITVHTLSGDPEQILRNREQLRSICEKIMSKIADQSVQVEIDWNSGKQKKNST